MWDVIRLSSIGGFSLRKIAMSIVAVLSAALLWVVMDAPAASANAGWDGDRVVYERQRYEKETASIPGVPPGATAYVYKQPDQGLAHVIYFEPGVNIDDATGAKHMVVGFSPPSTYSGPQEARDIQVEPKSGAADRSFGTTGRLDNDQGEVTNCAITGIGWLICPITRFLATVMDTMYTYLTNFLKVKPLSFDTESPLYRMWSIMRGFANIAFVAAFLVIVYSQVTGGLLSNYSLKKMIPRLIIAAVLVNISYIICAAAVDLSNILGFNLQQMFMDLRYDLVGATTEANRDITALNWENVSAYVLSGGTLAAAAGIGGFVALGSGITIMSLAYMLLIGLLGVLFAVIVALLVLAARQALIIVLIVLAPLAFVAYLLPNTEKWFDKWRDSFMTMLLLFPIFSVIFGGSQLAGNIIIQTADNLGVVLMGMFVQVAPVVITPFLVKFSGGLLGRLAGIVNNPSKGLLDRARNGLRERDELQRKRQIAKGHASMAEGGRGFGRGWSSRFAAKQSLKKHEREAEGKKWEELSNAHAEKHWKERLYGDDEDYGTDMQSRYIPRARSGYRKNTNLLRTVQAHTYASTTAGQALDAMNERQKEEAKAGQNAGLYQSVNDQVVKSAQDIALENAATQSAKRIVNAEYSKRLEDNATLQIRAGGIDPKGAQRALAQAIATRHNDRAEVFKNLSAIIDDVNPSGSEELMLAKGMDLNITMPDGTRKFIQHSKDIQEAAIKRIASSGNVGNINALAQHIDLSPSSDIFLRTAFVDALRTNGSKPVYFSAGVLDQMSQGNYGNFDGTNNITGIRTALKEALEANKFDAKGLISNDKDTLNLLIDAMDADPSLAVNNATLIKTAIDDIILNADFKGAMGNRKPFIQKIGQKAGYDFSSVDW